MTKFVLKAQKKDEGIFMDLFRANRVLFKDVEKRENGDMVEFRVTPKILMILADFEPIKDILRQEKNMGTEFSVELVLT